MIFFERWQHWRWPKHATEIMKNNKDKKRDLNDKTNRKPKETEQIDKEKPFKSDTLKLFFSWNKSKETRQEKTANKQGRKQIMTRNKEKKINKKRERERERERAKKEKWKKPRGKKGRHWEMNKNNPFSGENSVFEKKENQWKIRSKCSKTHVQP